MKLSVKTLCILLAAAMLLGCMPTAYAQSTQQITEGDFVYSIAGNEAAVTAYTGSGGTVNVPETVQGYSVTAIAEKAFYKNKAIRNVSLPEGICSVGEQAFFDCSQMESIHLPDSLESIGEMAFDNCFALTEVTIPENVRTIGTSAFSNCVGLQSLQVAAINPYFYAENSVIFSKDGKTLLYYYNFTASAYTVPAQVETISEWSFANNSKLQRVTLNAGLKTIGKYAFSNSGLVAIAIPDSVTKVDTFAFRECIQLQEVTIGDGLKTISDYSFSNCSGLNSVTLSEGLETIGRRAFAGCGSIGQLTIPDSVTLVESDAFRNSTLGTVRYYSKRQMESLSSTITGSNVQCLCRGEHTYLLEDPDQCTVCGFVRNLPDMPSLVSKTYDTVKLVAQSGFEYSYDRVNWRTDGIFAGLSPNRTYGFYCRLVGSAWLSGVLEVTTDKAPQPKAAAPVIQSTTETAITLKTVEGCEYSMDGSSWQKSPIFSGLQPGTAYRVYQRLAATATHLVGEISDPTMVQTADTAVLTSTIFTVKDDVIRKIPLKTTVLELLAGLKGGENCRVVKNGAPLKTTDLVGTGMTVELLSGNQVKASYTLVVTGDPSGDGKTTITDLIAIKAHLLRKSLLTGLAALGADTSGEGEITITDFIQIKASILGKGTIVPN